MVFNCMQMVDTDLCIGNMSVQFSSSLVFPFYLQQLKETANYKVKGLKEQNGIVRWSVKQQQVKLSCQLSTIPKFWSLLYKFHHSTNLFLHVVYSSIFCLVAFFMLLLCWTQSSAFSHQASLPSQYVSLMPFINLHCSHNLSLLDIKRLQKV